MIWTTVMKGGALVSFVQGAIALVDKMFSEEIAPHRIYSSVEAAELLGLERIQVLDLVSTGALKAKKVGDNYRILGSNIVEYMNR
ncbi:magnetosome protein MamR [Magnetospirillum sp. UT-4]|uniref:magnetosome protein MamR n=1 Tax=Magnetospirillum sp. UT-4 TaxID=2681467 RepID=UPI00138072F5|nr:magnetosome protein MamR [Magnetospirillum sp. UT-4]CAA7622258.1 Magnetosome protein MamR, containing Excisionase/Xis, DNA-binding domain [Magnetospirillum sp. UT-4]